MDEREWKVKSVSAKSTVRVQGIVGQGVISRGAILFFFGVFVVIYLGLLAPWPGWSHRYGEWVRNAGNSLFFREQGKWLIRFEEHEERQGLASINSRIVLGNRDQPTPQGGVPAVMLGLDTRGMMWVPTALTIALILATPIPWRRRFLALVTGLILIHLFILGSITVYIFAESSGIGLTKFPPFLDTVAEGAEYILINQYGCGFYTPVLIWIMVCGDTLRCLTSKKAG